MNYSISDYTYELPDRLIAQKPASPRDSSRMLVLNKESQEDLHQAFRELPDFLEENSILVVNNSRVIPARLPGQRETGGAIEALLVQEEALGIWKCKVKNAARIKPGERLAFCQGAIQARLVKKLPDGTCLLQFQDATNLYPALEQHGFAPLPPYIRKARQEEGLRTEDLTTYQTIFAQEYGAVAAPTAGLHFSPQVMDRIREKGIEVLEVTLHVGLGTFEPIRVDDVRQHQMHEERYEISKEVAERITQAKRTGQKVIAVGTTSARTLEAAWQEDHLVSGTGSTDIFIYPPYQFQVVDQLLTNFHLPESTLLMLVSALAGKERMMAAYQGAVEQDYRFYSYGDCMLIQ